MTDFHFVNSIPGPWEYVELTELHFERDPSSDSWTFALLLWSDDSSMTGRCVAVTLDGADLN
ncbi:hypothetical protein [Demequina sp.]|uniref:hypothetical protein n=1 Tax=Demequina sp. TaxID=2050685 RepID=UPI0025B86E80|nr:hypothetical protein [Demequina sp.]